jgi:hypothetical protein
MNATSSLAAAIVPLDKNGTGNWHDFNIPLERIRDAASQWKRQLTNVDRPWLCWSVSPRWSLLQQRLVQHVGWTPVVGYDPRVGPPPVAPGAILIHFNEGFDFSTMWPHFPLEFAFMWAPRLAFWHADLVCRLSVMGELKRRFEALQDGQTTAVLDRGGRRNWFNTKRHRFWELCGCTTHAASENQFYNGTGWWRNFALHPKCTLASERDRRKRYSYDSGVGVLYWKVKYNGEAIPIDIGLVKEGHCSEINNPNYQAGPDHLTPRRNLGTELDMNYDLDEVSRQFGIREFLD